MNGACADKVQLVWEWILKGINVIKDFTYLTARYKSLTSRQHDWLEHIAFLFLLSAVIYQQPSLTDYLSSTLYPVQCSRQLPFCYFMFVS